MDNVTDLHPTPTTAYRYKPGDITRALAEGLKHEQVAADIEAAFNALLFNPDGHSVWSARELLSDLLCAMSEIEDQGYK